MVELLVVALSVFGFAMVSRRAALSSVTAPMVFTGAGLLVGTVGADLFDLSLGTEVVVALVEATLVLVLFTDAARIDLRALRGNAGLPGRLLGVGLPLTILTGTAVAALVFRDLTLVEAGLIAAILAPTDAALGQAVVSDRRLPVRIRQSVNVESGLNDGMMVPVITVLLAIAAVETGGTDGWGMLLARQLGFGLLAGVVIGGLGGRLLNTRSAAGAVDGIYRQLATLAVAAGAFATAEVLHGNGFIAAFVAGLAFARAAGTECADVQDFTEDEGELLTAITFFIFGAALAGPRLADWTWQIGLYALASLTVVRVVPVLLALARSGTLVETRLFLGWFGPRGLASILFALLVSQQLQSPRVDTVLDVAVWTVLVSVYAHGVSASPWAARLGTRLSQGHPEMPERGPAAELPTRRNLG